MILVLSLESLLMIESEVSTDSLIAYLFKCDRKDMLTVLEFKPRELFNPV